MRDRAISFIKDRNLKSILYREETLTLTKLMEIVSQYHDKEALILVRENVNNIVTSPKQGGKCWQCDKVGHFAKECYHSRDHKCGKCGKLGHFEICCHSKQPEQNSGQTSSRSSNHGCGNTRGKPQNGKNKGNSQGRGNVNQLTENQMGEEDDADSDDFYMSITEATDEENTGTDY